MLIVATTVFLYYTTWTLLMVPSPLLPTLLFLFPSTGLSLLSTSLLSEFPI